MILSSVIGGFHRKIWHTSDTMVHLFISEPNWSLDGGDDSVKRRISLLNNLESIVRLLIASQSRSEVRLWLCKDLSRISSLSRRQKHELFVTLLRTSSQKRDLAAQVVQMIFEKHPKKAGSVIAKKSDMLEDFFRGNPRRILLWFSNFAGTGDMEHRKGAKALSQFAFVNRDICWEELEWKGKHGQSPAMVATKPHYFLDLDVEQTVENFLENVPEFWSSHEFADTLKDGDILFMDMKFFVNLFVSLMYKDDMEEVWRVINEFLMEEPFSSLCSHLLIVLDERELSASLDLLQEFLDPKTKPTDSGDTCMEVILPRYSGSDSFDELLLLNAVINRGRQLLQLLREDEHREEGTQIKDVVQQLCTLSTNSDDLGPLIKECSKTKSINSIKLLGLQSWALHFFLSDGNWPPEAWESLFNSNDISFRHLGKHELLHHNGLADDGDSDSDGRRSPRSKRKKKGKHRKKRRRNLNLDDRHNNDLLDLDFSYDRMDFQSKASYWLLSTDGYSTSWSSADLPEYLSKHCFSLWLKWGFSGWGDSA
ncbi:uncharacterized protein LOC112513269 isoform X1 [Cynara cardunculus var. scolymus]|uniref:uncharacterized protein LOC112513269 isoform X1 n=2 Tax=Cynara cardunculus var. scolymus TaxID=59895 RepID=UPI000D62958A|nr:uncharacterized protein LOC112513269 isoform X1 [Cynara cardunculus var. scolymus]XP_024975254.1 uncharacterized protein LOC112513269 isoform X1 [Cynara cardunculus var. scolymus]XP_024975255.1 uncharacterized protein LOC112513269 isoform X1 [Cynara cardunculus var. scolymus]